jgi:hypothetical protein
MWNSCTKLWDYVGQVRSAVREKRLKLFLFRSSGSLSMNFPENKGACRSNTPGPQRPPSGTSCVIFARRWHALKVNLSYLYQNNWLKFAIIC